VSYTPGASVASNLGANLEIIKQLTRFQEQGAGRATVPGEVQHLSAGATFKDQLTRLRTVLTLVNVRQNWPDLHSKLTTLSGQVASAITEVQAADPDDRTSGPYARTVITSARAIVETGTDMKDMARQNPTLEHIQTLLELLNNIKEAGTDTSQGQRNIYSEHAYAITGVDFKPSAPRMTELESTRSAAELGRINMTTSMVTLRNPHKTNVPDLFGTGAANQTGEFTMTLVQFLRNFSHIDQGVARRT
jgi:hypothetical protein